MKNLLTDNVPPTFSNVEVTAIPKVDGATGKTRYKATFNPQKVDVTSADTVINYQLVNSPADVRIKYITISSDEYHQLSKPSYSTSGKMVTLSDAYTNDDSFFIKFKFHDISTNEEFDVEVDVDPEVENVPRLVATSSRMMGLMSEPEVENPPR